jgi:hypothetical protein
MNTQTGDPDHLHRQDFFKTGENILFLHTGDLPSLHAYEREVLGQLEVAN